MKDTQMDRQTEKQGQAGKFVRHVYYLLEKEEIKPPSRRVGEFPLRKKVRKVLSQ